MDRNEAKIEILRCIVGSHAHGLATPESDKDYRSVYIISTSELLKVGGKVDRRASHIETMGEDNTAYELGHFLSLAIKSNPSILEVFKAPIVDGGDNLRIELQKLFPFVWSSKD